MKKLIVQRIISAPPDQAPTRWLVFNAPRPLRGDRNWEGQFKHGIFYVAIDPMSDEANDMVAENDESDGWLCQYVTEEAVMAWAREYFRKYPEVNLEEVDREKINYSYLYHKGSEEIEYRDCGDLLRNYIVRGEEDYA
jgi:hypothetical protein